MSWIRGLSQPDATPASPIPFYSALVPRAPRHADPSDRDLDDTSPASRTAPIRRISAEQVDTLIGHLDAVGSVDAEPADSGVDLGLALFDADAAAVAENRPADESPAEDDSTGDDGHGADPAADHESHSNAVTPESPASTDDSAQVTAPTDTDDTPTTVVDARSEAQEEAPTRVTPRRGRLRKPVLAGAAAALCLLTLAGATVTTVNNSNAAVPAKTVSVVVDGQAQRVTTSSDSVEGALAAAGITPTGHDVIAPAVTVPISDGSTVVVKRGRMLTLTIDGRTRQIWTTATTVEQALSELGTRTANLSLSANRSRAIPLTGLSVTGSTLHTVDVSVGGAKSTSSTTTARTVGDLLAADGIVLGRRDTVSPALTTKLSDGLVITVNRVLVSTGTKTVVLPEPAAKTVGDATLVKGQSKVVQPGTTGRQLITYAVTTVNGKRTAQTETSRKIIAAPVAKVTHVGTKTTFTYVGNEVFTNDTSFGVNWDGLAMCESTHNPKAVNANPSAGLPTYGMFQFDIPTWATVGGSGNPMDASPEEQLMRAKLLYQQRGLEPWACAYAAH
ncbi:resuscitation-promoting factor [Nakamurella panacisegetis]|nr:resuscitation-promoting factor [Nakamurella panacisegetis]